MSQTCTGLPRPSFLADRTNGRAIATVLRPSSSSVTLCIVAKLHPRAKVTIESL